MKNILLNNMIALLSEGAFGNKGTIVPMSPFKWETMFRLADKEDIAPYVYRGIVIHESDTLCNITDNVLTDFSGAAFNDSDSIRLTFDINKADSLNLSSLFKKLTLKDIIYKERHAIDTSISSLSLLALIIQNTHIILKSGIRLRGIIELGLFLRNQGQNVDYVKLSGWIERLKLNRMAALQAGVLKEVFAFDGNEFPFVNKPSRKSGRLTLKSIRDVYNKDKQNKDFSKYSIKNCARFYNFAPMEASAKAVKTLLRSLSEIEE